MLADKTNLEIENDNARRALPLVYIATVFIAAAVIAAAALF